VHSEAGLRPSEGGLRPLVLALQPSPFKRYRNVPLLHELSMNCIFGNLRFFYSKIIVLIEKKIMALDNPK